MLAIFRKNHLFCIMLKNFIRNKQLRRLYMAKAIEKLGSIEHLTPMPSPKEEK